MMVVDAGESFTHKAKQSKIMPNCRHRSCAKAKRPSHGVSNLQLAVPEDETNAKHGPDLQEIIFSL